MSIQRYSFYAENNEAFNEKDSLGTWVKLNEAREHFAMDAKLINEVDAALSYLCGIVGAFDDSAGTKEAAAILTLRSFRAYRDSIA